MLFLEKVSRFYGSRLIFKDISLKILAGSITLLVGANGAGKSTLLKIMAGLILPTSGTVRLELPNDIPGNTPGFLGHQGFLYPNLTAQENLVFWSRMNGLTLSEKEITTALERVELAPFSNERVCGFSRGMSQRVSLARVLLQNPSLLLLDEPASGLDVRSTQMLHTEIAAAKARGAAIVWITHSLESDINRADYVAALENRRLTYSPTSEYHT